MNRTGARNGGAAGAGGAAAEEELFLRDHDNQLGALGGKISALKSLTIDINDEVRNQNRLLDEMDTDFSTAGGMLAGTMNKLTELMGMKSSKHMCMLVVFVVFILVVIYYLGTHSSRTAP